MNKTAALLIWILLLFFIVCVLDRRTKEQDLKIHELTDAIMQQDLALEEMEKKLHLIDAYIDKGRGGLNNAIR